MIKRLLNSEATWRYIDAYLPRVFGLCFHTYLLRQYGGELYALPGWMLGILGLCMALIPDPHSYILVRAHGVRARRLLGLAIPSLILKAATCSAIVFATVLIFPTAHMVNAHESAWPAVLAATVLYGSVEFFWAVLGTISLATGGMRRVALWGLVARLGAIVAIAIAWVFGESSMTGDLCLASIPVLVMWILLSPWRFSPSRSWRFFVFSLRTYAGWNQGIALATNMLFQMPLLMLGMYPEAGAATVGHLAYISRILQAVLQPFQILQSIVIRDVAQAARGVARLDASRLQWVFRAGSIGVMVCGSAVVGAAVMEGVLSRAPSMLALAMVAGVAVTIWNRYELSKVLATSRLKELFMIGYLPVVSMTLFMAVLAMRLWGLAGLAPIIFIGWVGLSVSWKWVDLKWRVR